MLPKTRGKSRFDSEEEHEEVSEEDENNGIIDLVLSKYYRYE